MRSVMSTSDHWLRPHPQRIIGWWMIGWVIISRLMRKMQCELICDILIAATTISRNLFCQVMTKLCRDFQNSLGLQQTQFSSTLLKYDRPNSAKTIVYERRPPYVISDIQLTILIFGARALYLINKRLMWDGEQQCYSNIFKTCWFHDSAAITGHNIITEGASFK
jgi:hypothetical protein